MIDLGMVLGNYRLEHRLGAGGMGQVYAASHLHLDRRVAIKVLQATIAADSGFQARFRQEAQVIAALQHPNIVQIVDFGEQQGLYYLVMELVSDGSLRALLQRQEQPRFSMAFGLELLHQAAQALAFAHSRGMIHRDVKPDNMLLSRRPGPDEHYQLKLSDFGLARLTEGNHATASGVMMGTPAYMSPEQYQGLALDARTDIYALGVMLYELVIGELPFPARTLSEAAYQHVHMLPAPPRRRRPDLPNLLESILLRCLAKDREERFKSASDLADGLQELLSLPALATIPLALTRLGASEPSRFVDESLVRSGGFSGQRAPVPYVQVADADGHVLQFAPVSGDGITIGRLPANTIVLDSEEISRYHARIDWDGQRVYLTDLGSSNGTLLDNRLLPAHVAAPWRKAQVVCAGPYWLRLVNQLPAGWTASPAAPAALIAGMAPQTIGESPALGTLASLPPQTIGESPALGTLASLPPQTIGESPALSEDTLAGAPEAQPDPEQYPATLIRPLGETRAARNAATRLPASGRAPASRRRRAILWATPVALLLMGALIYGLYSQRPAALAQQPTGDGQPRPTQSSAAQQSASLDATPSSAAQATDAPGQHTTPARSAEAGVVDSQVPATGTPQPGLSSTSRPGQPSATRGAGGMARSATSLPGARQPTAQPTSQSARTSISEPGGLDQTATSKPVMAQPSEAPATEPAATQSRGATAVPTSARAPSNTVRPPTAVPPTAVPPTAVPPTAVPPTAVPPTARPPTAVPPTAVPPTAVPPTAVPPTAVPPTAVPPTAVPPTAVPPTAVPPTAVPPTDTPVPPTAVPCYKLTLSNNPWGGILTSPGPNCGGEYSHGTVVRLEYRGAACATFQGWTGDASGGAYITSITMDRAKSVGVSINANNCH